MSGAAGSLESAGLRVVFERRGDRYAHAVWPLAGDAVRPVLQSDEGAPSDPWPPSPPLTSLSVGATATGAALLLTGAAGTSHWSLSVAPLEGEDGFCFDAACRLAVPPRRLGSAYTCSGAATVDRYGQRARFRLGGVGVELEVLGIEGTRGSVVSGGGEQVLVMAPRPERLPATARWRFALRRFTP